MKNLILSLALCMIYSFSTAQLNVKNGIDVLSQDLKYISVKSFQTYDNVNFSVSIDYGQPKKAMKNYYLIDENGKNILFDSEIELLNFFYTKGYEFVRSKKSKVGETYLLSKY